MKEKTFSLLYSISANAKKDYLSICTRFCVWVLILSLIDLLVSGWANVFVWLVFALAFYLLIYVPIVDKIKSIEAPTASSSKQDAPKASTVSAVSYAYPLSDSEWPVQCTLEGLTDELISQRNALTPDINACISTATLWTWCWPNEAAMHKVYVRDIKESKNYLAFLTFAPGVHPLRVVSVDFVTDSMEIKRFPNLPYIREQADELNRTQFTNAVNEFVKSNISEDAAWYWLSAANLKIAIMSQCKELEWEPAVITLKRDRIVSVSVGNQTFCAKEEDSSEECIFEADKPSGVKASKNDVVIEDTSVNEPGLDISKEKAAADKKVFEHYKGKLGEEALAKQLDSECAEAVCCYQGDGEEPCYYVFPAGDDDTWENYAIRDNEAEIFAAVVVDTIPNISGVSCINREKRKITFVVDV